MSPKLPFYMAYPMPLAFDDERVERNDYEYMKSLYPAAAKKILPYIEDECDRCEHPLGMMYDEYPDCLQMRMMCKRIRDRIRREEHEFYLFDDPGVRGESLRNRNGVRAGDNQRDRDNRKDRDDRRDGDNRRDRDDRRDGDNRRDRDDRRDGDKRERDEKWLRDLIEVMLYQELYKRRSDHRRALRRFY